MKIAQIKDAKIWNQFVSAQAQSQFLQSWEWGEFQKTLGRGVERWAAIDEAGVWQAATQVFIYPVNFKICRQNYWYLSRGPIGEKVASQKLLDFLTQRARAAGAMFFKCEPLENGILKSEELSAGAKCNCGCRTAECQGVSWQAVKSVQPRETWLLKLDDEEKMLAAMHPKTRYNIRLAMRKQPVVKISDDQTIIDEFYEILKHTAQRETFGIYGRDYYRQLGKILAGGGENGKDGAAGGVAHDGANFKIYLGYAKNRPVGGILVMFFGDMATYLYGGFDEKYRAWMLPHLLQWHALSDARSMGCRYYDFWGVAPAEDVAASVKNSAAQTKATIHPWAGLSRFKRSFGGFGVSYPGAYDLIFKKGWTGVYKMAKRFLR